MIMKNLIMSAAAVVLLGAGCAVVEPVEDVQLFPGTAQCTPVCAADKAGCPFLGKWEFLVEQNGQLVALPVENQPQMELCADGVMRFHYVKDGKSSTLEGRWQIDDGVLAIFNKDVSNIQCYVLQPDNTGVYYVGANDRLPQNTKVVIRKIR